MLEEQRSEQNLNANNLTMSQALELFELLQSRRAADVVKPPIIEAQQVEMAPGRAEPLSFMTLQTVERIIESVGKLGSTQARVGERKQVRDKQVRDERRRRELQRILSPPLI